MLAALAAAVAETPLYDLLGGGPPPWAGGLEKGRKQSGEPSPVAGVEGGLAKSVRERHPGSKRSSEHRRNSFIETQGMEQQVSESKRKATGSRNRTSWRRRHALPRTLGEPACDARRILRRTGRGALLP